MRIAINGWFWNELGAGSGQYLHQLLAWMPRQAPQTQFDVYIPQRVRDEARSPAFGKSRTSDAANLHIIPTPLAKLPRNLAKLWWEQVQMPLAARRSRADLLWIPYWAAPLWQPCPTAVTIHDLIHLLLPAYHGGRLQRLYTALVSHTARRADAILTVSHAGARDIVQHLNVPGEKVHVVYNGMSAVDEQVRNEDYVRQVRAKYELPARYFLYLGGFDVRKNVQATLAAYARYLAQGGDPQVKMVIAGKLPAQDSAFAPDPRRMAAALGLGEQVHFCGWVDEADKPAIYAQAVAYFFPSLYEGFGLMVLEAMGAGAPVVTSANSKTP
ncbi:MAG: glycosyltransferase family 1 protein [Caldilineaceae bacterium]